MRSLVAAVLVTLAAGVLIVSVGTPDARDVARRLDAESASERDAAARELTAEGEGARETLETLVHSGSPEARRRSRALLAVLDAGDDLDARVRTLEARALLRAALRQDGRLAEGSPRDARLRELSVPGADVLAERAERRLTRGFLSADDVLALARHPSANGVRALAAALHGERVVGSAIVRAARALEGASPALLRGAARDDLRRVLSAVGDPRRRAAAALLLAFDPAASRTLARDPDARVRIEAAHALGRLEGAGARALTRLSRDPDANVRVAALRALYRVPGAPRPGPAHAGAEHPDPAVRATAARLLSRDAVPASLAVLTRLATDDSARVRAAAERSLAVLSRR